MNKIKLNKEPLLMSKLKAFPFQEEAVNSIKNLPFSAVFHEQGLGKTKIAIDLLLYWLECKGIDTVLIITKKQLIQNWVNELKYHTHIKPSILTSNRKDNYYTFNGPSRIIITNFEVVSSEKERFHLFLAARNVAIIIDESAKLKNPNTKITKDFFDLSPKFKIKTIMTGTPIANRPYDIWAQIYFLDFGNSLGSDFDEFKNKTDLVSKLYSDTKKRNEFENSISEIFSKIEKFTVRETKNSGIIILPDKEYISLIADFEPHQKVIYEKIKKGIAILLEKDGETFIDDSTVVLKKLLRLLQTASNPRLIDDMYSYLSGKEIILDNILDQIISKNEKCIVWSSFIENIDYFANKYEKYNPVKIHGKMPIDNRNKSIQNFSYDEYKILFATPQSAKEGLTLTMANHVIFYDRGFSLDDYLQAQDRIHRISQTKTCYIYNILLDDSIDLWVDVLLKAKQNAAFLAQGDISKTEYQNISDYSFGSLVKKILNMD